MEQTRIVFLFLVIGILPASTAFAEFVGINIGAAHWSPALSGTFNSNDNGSSIDLVDDLGINSSDTRSSLVLILEHPIQSLPNIKYQGFRLDSSGAETLNSNLDFNGQTFNSGNRVTTSFNLSHDDIVFYYGLIDNWINLDMGVDLKRFDGEVALSGNTSSRLAIDETIPLLYLSARFDLPYDGFYIGANFNNLGLGSSSVEDTTIKLGYETNTGIGVEGGIKTFSLELDDADNLDTDLKYDGIFLNGFYRF